MNKVDDWSLTPVSRSVGVYIGLDMYLDLQL